MKLIEIGTGYTSIPAKVGAATELVVEELAKSCVRMGQDVVVLDVREPKRAATPFPVQDVWLPGILLRATTTLGVLHKIKRILYSVALGLKLRRTLKSEPDKAVVHFHNQYNWFFGSPFCKGMLRKKATTLYTVHSYVWNRPWDEIRNSAPKKYFMEIKAIRECDVVCVLNETVATLLKDCLGIPASKIKIVDNGVNCEVYAPTRTGEREIGPLVVVHTGSVCPRKNQLEIVRKLLPALQSGEVVFRYAGGIIDAGYQRSILEFCDSNGVTDAVTYAGELSPGTELRDFYGSADLFVFDSTSESFGLVVLEALSCGLPVLLNRRLEGIFRAEPNSGIVYFSDSDFIETMRNMVSTPGEVHRLGVRGREYAKRHYSWGNVANRYLELGQTTGLLS